MGTDLKLHGELAAFPAVFAGFRLELLLIHVCNACLLKGTSLETCFTEVRKGYPWAYQIAV